MPERVEVPLVLSLTRKQFAALTARAIRERKPLHQLASEILATEAERRR